MRVVAILLLLFGPLLSAPAAAGLWTRAWLGEGGQALASAIGAGVIAALLVVAMLRRPGLMRQVAVVVLSAFWAGWLWLEMTAKVGDWTRPPPLHAPDGAERAAILLIILAYLMLYTVAAQRRPPDRAVT